VHLNQIALYRFRNLADAQLDFSPGLNLIIGRNGQGKTNLLEAVHLLALAHSPRARSEKDCVAWGQKSFILRGEGVAQSGLPHAQSVEYGDEAIRVKVQGKESRRMSSLMGAFTLVAFSPEDLELVRGGPMIRRRFLDVMLCQMDTEAMDLLRQYQVAIKQRNAALRAESGPDPAILDAYEKGAATFGARIILKREALVASLKPWAQSDYTQLSNGSEALGLRMTRSPLVHEALNEAQHPNEATGQEQIQAVTLAAALADGLRRSRLRDQQDGVTSVGPHRDDLMIFLAGKSARDFGSQGQKRSVALSLRMASAQALRERLQTPPLLLLDDVFAELDAQRQAALGELLRERGQAFVATPRQGELPFAADAIYTVEGGVIAKQAT
jgi:DNA replication and repair protein RecF